MRTASMPESSLFGINTRPGIICAECGEMVEILTKTHIAKHGLTQNEYLRRHPNHCYLHMWPDLPTWRNQEKYKEWRERLGVEAST